MPLSRYCTIFPHPDDPGLVLLFSTRTTAAVTVPKVMINEIAQGRISHEEEESLVTLGMLVQSHDAEQQDMAGYIDEMNRMSKALRMIVVMSLDCNLACPYCFEGTRKGKFYLSEKTADDLVSFIQGNAEGRAEIGLCFYGGEPLLSTKRIIEISEKLRTCSDAKGIKYSFSLITNGTLLTRPVVEELKMFGLRSCRVTLDGPRGLHDRSRPFRSGAGTFDIIIRNLEQAAGAIDVHVNGNFTEANYRAFPGLLDLLVGSGLGPDRISSIGFYPVFNEGTRVSPDFHDGCTSTDELWVAEAGTFLRGEILARGYRTEEVEPSACMIERTDHLVVNWDGSLYKCPGLIGRKEFCAGTVLTGVVDHASAHGIGNWKNAECLACKYLPLCFGGCRYLKLIREGALTGVDCKRAYFDRALEALVLQDVKYGNDREG
ncbi:MAG TPA: geopeptide radical SAM maturase [Nitrospirota bacterium]